MMSIFSNNQNLQKSRLRISILDFDRRTLFALIHDNLRGKKVIAAYVFGSFARENENLWSDIDLIIVKDSSLPFIERPREFFDLLDIGVPLDILVYTSGEFAKIKSEQNGFWKEAQSKIIQIV